VTAGKILFVEDEDSISEPFSELLRAEGFETVVARTAADALTFSEQLRPDVVLLDVMLPDGDGRDVCRELRRRSGRGSADAPRLSSRPVVDRRGAGRGGADARPCQPAAAARCIPAPAGFGPGSSISIASVDMSPPRSRLMLTLPGSMAT